jgi:hypothetical protein
VDAEVDALDDMPATEGNDTERRTALMLDKSASPRACAQAAALVDTGREVGMVLVCIFATRFARQ